MAKYSVTLSANTAGTFVCNVRKKRDLAEWRGLLMAYGGGGSNFGSGTVAWNISPNGGATLIPMTDLVDTAITMTTNKAYDASLTTGSNNDDMLSIYVALTGSTTPTIVCSVYDNNY
jgi:hypothetical protein